MPNGWSRYQPRGSRARAALRGPPGCCVRPPNFPARGPGCLGSELRLVAAPARRQASAARCIISNLYKALKGIQRSNWEALKLKWGWDLESTLEPAVWREAWGSISSVLISGEPNINVFWRFYSSSPGVYMRVGFLFSFFFFLCCCFFCTLKPLPSVILEEAHYRSVWGTTVLLSGLAAGTQRCPTPVTSLVTAALPESRGWGGTRAGHVGSKVVLLAGARPPALCCQTDAIWGRGCAARGRRERGDVPIAAASGLLCYGSLSSRRNSAFSQLWC